MSVKFRIYRKSNCRCHYCRDDLIKIIMDGLKPTIDHKIPKIRGGTDDDENLVLCCSFCNSSKGDKNESEMLMYIEPYVNGKCEKGELKFYHKYLGNSAFR